MPDKQMIENPALEIRIPNWYDVDTDKLTSTKDIADFLTCLEMKVSDTSKNFEKVKKFLIIPEPRKTLEEIQEDFEKKIDNLIERTKRSFYASNLTAENNYNRVFDKIADNFETAKRTGEFPQHLHLITSGNISIGNGVIPNSYLMVGNSAVEWGTEFNLNPSRNAVGYYYVEPDVKFNMTKKPNFVVRFFMNKLLGFKWRSKK